MFHVVGVHVRNSLGDFSTGHSASEHEHLLTNLLVDSFVGLSAHKTVPEAVSTTDNFDFVDKLTPGDWDVNTSEVHVSGEDFISINVVTPKTAVRVGFVFTVLNSDINKISEHDMHTVVLLHWGVTVLSVLVNSIASDHVLHKEEGVVVWVLSAWGIEEDTNICVDHLIISHHEEGWNIDTLFSSFSVSDGLLSNRGKLISDLLDEGIVINVSSSNDDHVVSIVVGSSEALKRINRQFSKKICISSNWLSHLVISECVVMDGFHSSSLHVLVASINDSLNLLLGKLKLSRVKSSR